MEENPNIVSKQYSIEIYHFLDAFNITNALNNEDITAWSLSFKKSEDQMKLSFRTVLTFEKVSKIISDTKYFYSHTLTEDF